MVDDMTLFIMTFFPTITPAVKIPCLTVIFDDGMILIPHLTTRPDVHRFPAVLYG